MSVEPLKALGRWRATEGLIEIMIPFTLVGVAWSQAKGIFATPTAARGLTPLELAVMLGACAALTGWMASRQMFMARRRNPWSTLLLTLVYVGGIMAFLPGWVRDGFATTCTETYLGQVFQSADLTRSELLGRPDTGPTVCKVGGVPDNPYLPGTLLRPSWQGDMNVGRWALVFVVAAVGSLGLRDRRVVESSMIVKLLGMLRYAPAMGHASSAGKPPAKDGKVVACNNATLWGEPCGQLYAAERVFQPGEWCGRCSQPFRRADRTITFKVVSLFSADVDVLNGVERMDMMAWDRYADTARSDGRPSGIERWVQLGMITLPDVVTVAQALSIVHDMLPLWSADGTDQVKDAALLAKRRASRVSCWIWLGSLATRLTHARPNNRAFLAIGPMRLRDLVTEGGDEVWLQLDVGLMPLELRYGGRGSFEEKGVRKARVQDFRVDMWIPVAPPNPPKGQAGIWVPRIEGDAIRVWLSEQKLRPEGGPDAPAPLPYVPLGAEATDENSDERALQIQGLTLPKPGSLDFVRRPLDPEAEEPLEKSSIGDSISEWAWLEWEQIQLLRQQCLVLQERPSGGGRGTT